ncbi:hypothetical protein [Altibacter lentus]|uniref:hypothetical protein n=1 Tax=Altibacter lentus TaxID=1223410 RepID=UPI000553364B|nr:hypothetical protein [Altibacter lentus]
MRIFDRIKWIFKKPEYYAFEKFNIEDYNLRFEFLTSEILIEITAILKNKFNPLNLDLTIQDFERRIQKEIEDSEDYRNENNFRITYFLNEDLLKKKQGLFLYQCIWDNNDEIGGVISELYHFELRSGIISIQELD